MRMPIPLVMCVGLSVSCVSDQAHRYYSDDYFPPKDTKDVEILTRAPMRPYEVIADFQARGASEKYMQKKAAQVGADAVIIGTFGGYRSRRDEWASEDRHRDSYTRITGTAIIYKR